MEIWENPNYEDAKTAGRGNESLNAEKNGTQDSAIRAFMNRFIQTESGNPSIDELMEVIGRYFDADRSYIFEQDSTGQYSVNTYEWCAEGVTPEIQNLQEVPLSVLEPWWKEFRAKGSFYLSCNDEYAKQEPLVYEVLEPQGISSLIAAPFMLGSNIIGFLGVDNPKVHMEQQLFLSVAATMLNHEILTMNESRKEEKHKAELQTALDLAGESSDALNRVHEGLGSAHWKIEYDENGKETETEFSDGVRHLFGYENEKDFPNSPEFLVSIVHPADKDRMLKEVYDVLCSRDKNRILIASRYRARKKDGTIGWYRVQGLVKRRENGSAKLAYGVIMDVTELEEAEIGQREALEAFEAIHDAIGSANWQMTFDEKGNMSGCTWSNRFRKMLGYYSEEDFPNELSSWTDLLHPADKKMTLNAYWAAVNDRTGKTIYSMEYRLLTRTKGYRWYSAHGSLSRYEDGAPKTFYGIFLDVNDQVLSAQSQEASIREITELNKQLENNQAELEASASEQEAQIEKISVLNNELTEQRDNLERNFDAIQSLSKVYYASYYVDMDNDDYYELLSNDEIKDKYSKFGPKGKSQATLNWVCENRIAPEYREEARVFMDYSTLSKRMRDTETVSIRVQLVTGDWSRIRFIAGTRHEDGRLKSCIYAVRNVNDEVAEEQKQNEELQKALALAQDSAAEQEAQMEEIAALNAQLQENQASLEEATAEQEAQIEEITALNGQLESNQAKLEASLTEQEAQLEEIQAEREKVSEAYGMIEGLSSEYHTIWLVSKETLRMRLVRSNGISTAKGAVAMAKKVVELDPTVKAYVEHYVMPEDQERALKEMSSAEVLRHLNENKYGIYAVNYLRKDDIGRISYHQIAFSNADTDDGKKQFVLGFRDIDQIVKEEQNQKEELREALNLAQDANNAMANAGYGMWHIILKDGVAPRMQVNDKMAELLGIVGQNLTEEELYNAWYDQIVPDAIPSVQASVGEMMEGKFSENTYQWVHPTKGVIYVRCGGTAQKLEDGTDVLSGYHADVTDIVYEEKKHNEELRKAKEDAESANAAKTSFLFNMSHDIRTPMNAIMGFRDLLEKHQDEPEKRQDYLNKIQDSSGVLLSIINNVLEMARIEKGTLEIEETAWSTEQFNDTLYSVFHTMMEEKGLTFTRQIEVQHHYVYCDPTKLREIFINILSNAYKYTKTGGSVNMHLEEIPYEREGWVLYQTTISDTGIGMSEEFLPHIFEEFSREQNTTDAKVEGTGLGMPIVKRLVKMLDGTIKVKSKKGEGSTFIVTIPHRIADKANLVDHAGVRIDPKLFKDKNILLAEDNDFNAEIAIEMLEEDAGFHVDRAEDGAICVEMLKNAEAGYYDIILMDIQMPNMNGYEATRAIRALDDSEKANIKILAMTANAFEEDKREALRNGMNGHLAKPVRSGELMKALAGMIG